MTSRPLDLRVDSDRHALRAEAERAEDVAVRVADATRGLHSPGWVGMDQYVAARVACLDVLLDTIATRHGLNRRSVESFVGERPPYFDIAFATVFSALFLAFAILLIRLRFLPHLATEDLWVRLLAIAALGFVLSLAGYALGDILAAQLEMVRLGNGHLSYRAARIPWTHQLWPIVLSGTFIISLGSLAKLNGRSLTRAAIRVAGR